MQILIYFTTAQLPYQSKQIKSLLTSGIEDGIAKNVPFTPQSNFLGTFESIFIKP